MENEIPKCRLCGATLPESGPLSERIVDGKRIWWCLRLSECLRRAGWISMANVVEKGNGIILLDNSQDSMDSPGKIPLPGRLQMPVLDVNTKNRRGGGHSGIFKARPILRRKRQRKGKP